MTIEAILDYLDKNEIDYRLESNFCCGYIFYFLDGSVYPRRWMDYSLEGNKVKVIAETPDNIIEKSLAAELKKDWRHRIESETLKELFIEVERYLFKSKICPDCKGSNLLFNEVTLKNACKDCGKLW